MRIICFPPWVFNHRFKPLPYPRGRGLKYRGVPMPKKPPRPCSYPGCPALTHDRYCREHAREIDRFYNKNLRSPESKKWYGAEWRRVRARYLQSNPLCESCKQQGRLTPATEVHHVVSLAAGGSHAPENLRALCRRCHSSITAREGVRWGQTPCIKNT